MTDPVFQQAYAAVRHGYSEDAWSALTPRQITEEIYREIRRIDATRVSEADLGQGNVAAPPSTDALQSG